MKKLLSHLLISTLVITLAYTQSQQQQIDRQTQHIQQFARTMSDFVPTETFTFNLDQGKQENFYLWPAPQIQKIRGVFYIDNSEEAEGESGEGFFVGCEVNGEMKKPFVNERLGVFTLTTENKPANIKLIFKSDSKPLTVYLSYEMKKAPSQPTIPTSSDQNVPTKQQEQLKQRESKLKQVTQTFEKVRTSIQGQETALRMVLKMFAKQSKRVQNQVNFANHRIVVETVVIILSGLLGMWIIKKQMTSGYELLV